MYVTRTLLQLVNGSWLLALDLLITDVTSHFCIVVYRLRLSCACMTCLSCWCKICPLSMNRSGNRETHCYFRGQSSFMVCLFCTFISCNILLLLLWFRSFYNRDAQHPPTRVPVPAAERVISGPRSRLRNTRNFPWMNFMNEFKLH